MNREAQSGPFPFRILFVDDDENLASLYAELLRREGYVVRIAHSGFEALADLRQSLPDLVISDLCMPGMSGLELLAAVNHRFPNMPLVAISGSEALGSDALVADTVVNRAEVNSAHFLEMVAHLVRSSVARRRATPPRRLTWLPPAGGGLRISCEECLRSFQVPPQMIATADNLGVHTCTCIYCGTPQSFIVGDQAEAA